MAVEQLRGLTAVGAVLSPLAGSGPRTDAVVARISAAIGLGVISDGEQLPSEIDLATQLGVSTVTLREALAILREQGLVVTKRGRGGGSFVRASAEDVHTRSLALLQELTVEGLRDLGTSTSRSPVRLPCWRPAELCQPISPGYGRWPIAWRTARTRSPAAVPTVASRSRSRCVRSPLASPARR